VVLAVHCSDLLLAATLTWGYSRTGRQRHKFLILPAIMSKSRSGSSKKESESPPLGVSPKDTEVKSEDTYVTPTPDVKAETTPGVEESVTSPVAPDAKPIRKGPQLIGDLPCAEAEAQRTFMELPGNQYQYGTLGRSREALESMTCDCQYEHG
jgi:histone-lysine N-methyltransferase SETD2